MHRLSFIHVDGIQCRSECLDRRKPVATQHEYDLGITAQAVGETGAYVNTMLRLYLISAIPVVHICSEGISNCPDGRYPQAVASA